MLKRSWIQALCAAVCVLALTGCGGDECTTPTDCRNENGDPPENMVWACVQNKCVTQPVVDPEECNPVCADNQVCDTSSGAGVCRTCTATQGCDAPLICDVAANNGMGQCKSCTDSSSANTPDVLDLGCAQGSPVCEATGNNGLGVCKTCVDSAQGSEQDQGCSSSVKICDATGNNGAGVCKTCFDTAQGSDLDLGCSASSPVCDPSAANGLGACKTCADTAQGTDMDLGCSAEAPICNTTASGGRGACKACVDSPTGTDLGCDGSAPLCDVQASNGVGVCRSCLDSAAGTGTDQGCSVDNPFCDPLASSGAGLCRACVDSATGNGTDQGCSAASPICDPTVSAGVGACKVCVVSDTGSTDVGCTGSAPLCDPAAGSGAGACRACLDTTGPGSGTTDEGCFAPTSICDTTASSGVGACKVCVVDEGCPGSQTCNATGTACEGCLDDASCSTTPATPYCKPPPPVASCVQCIEDSHCTNPLQPACNITGFCGCSDDDDCAATNGTTDFCDVAANNNRGECKVCVTDANCSSADPSKPFCDDQTACIQCRTTADCAVTQRCNASNACEDVPGQTPTETNAKIQEFIALTPAILSPPFTIENVFVTYIKPALGDPQSGDVAGFFIQALATGPAIFVASDPSGVQVGDRITLSIGEKVEFSSKVQAAREITGLSVVSQGHPVQNLDTATPAGLAVDVSAATDLVSGVEGYFGKILHVTGTMTDDFGSGTGHAAYEFTTTGITETPLPRLRMPSTMVSQYDLVIGCTFTLDVGPMWKYTSSGTNPVTQAQPSAYSMLDFSALSCPAPKLSRARTPSITEVRLTFDRKLDSTTVQASDFTITNLTVAEASVEGNLVTLITSEQTGGQSYTVSVDGDVRDLLGTAVDDSAKTATFTGYAPPPSGPALVINEIDADNPSTDAAEFIEIHNRGGQDADLSNVLLVLVNGDATIPNPPALRREYLKFSLSAVKDAGGNPVTSLPAGGYIVAASEQYLTTTVLPENALRLTIAATNSPTNQNIIQNGTDGVGLVDDTTGALIDAVFYSSRTSTTPPRGTEFDIATTGAGDVHLDFKEGTISTTADLAISGDSIQRFPNGGDTNNNDYDFAYATTGTPGAANQ